MSSIVEWLRGLELGEYAEVFEAEKITLRALPDVTEADLKDMGLPIGPRRVVLRAISALPAETGSVPPSEVKTSEVTDQVSRPLQAERRQITIMFCDLVGSTALSERLDPEDLRSLMQSYQQAAGGVIERYEGHVAQYLGDGLMTYFGWPHAHEDDAERAVRAGLEIVAAVKRVEAPSPLQVRIGIATGPVVVGETGAGDASVPKLAVGETPNLAARLQGLAGADEIVIGHATRRLLGQVFALSSLGGQTLKGIVEPVTAYRVNDALATEGRFETRTRHLTPLVGRETEMAAVFSCWERAKAGDGQVVLLSGEPGIGKSRITQQLMDAIGAEPHVRRRYQCSPYHTNSALHPVIEQIERAADLQRGDTAARKRAKIGALFLGDMRGPALVASLLSLPSTESAVAEMTPQKRKEATLQVLAEAMAVPAAEQPVLLIFEDVHWIDPTSQELLDLVVPMISGHTVLAVITHRLEYEPPWQDQDHVTALALQRLDGAGAAKIVGHVSDIGPADDVLAQIIAKTDGVPLFVEELTKALAEGSGVGVPETLQDSLMARLDRLGPAKEIAQIGACLGREFTHDMLAAVCWLGESALASRVSQLVDSGLFLTAPQASGLRYMFKHALIRDTAHNSLLKSRRQHLHRQIADTMVRVFAEDAEAQPEIVARHYQEAGDARRAITYWCSAGARAVARSTNAEAVTHYQNALAQLQGMTQSRERDEQELSVLTDIFGPLIAAHGYTSDLGDQVRTRAMDLCDALAQPSKAFPFLYGDWLVHYIAGDAAKGLATAEKFVAQADRQSDNLPRAFGRRILAVSVLFSGQPTQALDIIREGQQLPISNAENSFVYGQDVTASLMLYRALSLAYSGYLDQARGWLRLAKARVNEFDHVNNHCYGMIHSCWLRLVTRQSDRARQEAEATLQFAQQHGLPTWIWIAEMFRAWALTLEGALDDALPLFREGLGHGGEQDGAWGVSMFRIAFADACSRAGALSDADALLDHVQALMTARGEHLDEAEAWRIRADIAHQRGDEDGAETSLRRAIAAARKGEIRLFEVRATTLLADHMQTRDRTTEARSLLAPVYDWFTEGFDATDLTDAKALLDNLEKVA